jgi:hypothetical protein
MGPKFQERGGRMLDLNPLKPILRAYALGYASSTIPRLLGLLRTLRRQDRTIQEKLDLVSPAWLSLSSSLKFQSSPIAMPPDDIGGKTTVFRISTCLPSPTSPHVHQAHSFIALVYSPNAHSSQSLPNIMRDHRRRHDASSPPHTRYHYRSCPAHRQ